MDSTHTNEPTAGHIHVCQGNYCLESERDKLAQEVERLKAAIKHRDGLLEIKVEERNRAEKQAEELAKVLEIIASYNMEATAKEMNYHKEIAEHALAKYAAQRQGERK